MAKTTGMNTEEKSELGYLLASDFVLNNTGKSKWKATYPALSELKSEARRLGASRIFYDASTVTMA